MFVNAILKDNVKLLECAFSLIEKGEVYPDTFIIDLDQIEKNATVMIQKAKEKNVELYFMLKQLGRNPIVAKKLIDLGFAGAVCVDYQDGLTMMKNNIKIAHMGHLVQVPKNLLERFIKYGVDIITCYSMEKILEINCVAEKLGIVQDISLRVYAEGDEIYCGQECGLKRHQVFDIMQKCKSLKNVKVSGLTTFPCFLYNEDIKDIEETSNLLNMLKLHKDLKDAGYSIRLINGPSATMTYTIEKFSEFSVNVGEPGHGLTGTTPLHAIKELPEKVAYCYVSEVSHNFNNKSYFYGGGLYRRGHGDNAIVKIGGEYNKVDVKPVSDESIDYHFETSACLPVSLPIIMVPRAQMFVTRSFIAVVSGISDGNYKIEGIFDTKGERYE